MKKRENTTCKEKRKHIMLFSILCKDGSSINERLLISAPPGQSLKSPWGRYIVRRDHAAAFAIIKIACMPFYFFVVGKKMEKIRTQAKLLENFVSN